MKPALKYGGIAAIVMIVVMFTPMLVAGPQPAWMRVGEIVGYTTMLLAMTATYFAMRAEKARRGAMSYGAAFLVGVSVSLVAALVFAVATWLLYTALGDALPEALLAFYRDQAGGDPAKLAQVEGFRSFLYNRPLQAAVMFATVFPIGVLESLIGAWLITRRP
jgi:Protein of unknown function (DUF4199)